VFVYLDDLAPVLHLAAGRLAASGAIAFSVETHAGHGVILRDTLRFAMASRMCARRRRRPRSMSLISRRPRPGSKRIRRSKVLAVLRAAAV